MGSITSPLFNAASIGMNAAQSRQAGAAQRMQTELAADNLEAQASRKELEAREVVELGKLDQAEEVRKGRADIAGQTVDYAASGVSVNSGSAVEVAADKAAWTEYERQKIEYSSNLESWGLKYDAASLRQKATNTRATASSGPSGAEIFINAGKQLSAIKLK